MRNPEYRRFSRRSFETNSQRNFFKQKTQTEKKQAEIYNTSQHGVFPKNISLLRQYRVGK